MECNIEEYKEIMKEDIKNNTLKFGDKVTITKTNCDGTQGFIFTENGVEPLNINDIKDDEEIYPIPDDE